MNQQNNSKKENQNSVLAIVCPKVGAVSETFIRKHIENLAPSKTVILTGQVTDESWFQGPVKIIPIKLGAYSFDDELEKVVIKYFEENSVTHILCEFGCIGGAVVELNNRIMKLPIFVHFHGQDASEFLREPEIAEYYKWMGGVVDGVIAVSKPMSQRLIDAGIPQEKIKIIHYGVDYNNECKVTPEKNPCRFVSVSRLVGKKGIQYVLQAFEKAKKEVPYVTLDIIGEGPLRSEIEKFISEHKLGESVKLHGEQSHEYVLSMMDQSSVFVQHSLVDPETGNREGLPLSILEASAHGLPVISTFHEGIPEAIEHENSGFLVEEKDWESMAEYMIKLAKNGMLRKQMGIAGREKISNEDFTVDVMLNNLRTFMGLEKEYNYSEQGKINVTAPVLKRVLFVNHSVYPFEVSGTPITTLNHALGIKNKGIEVAVLFPSNYVLNGFSKEVNENYTLYKVPRLDKYETFLGDVTQFHFKKYINTIENIISDFKPDLVHINDYVFMPEQVVSIFSKRGAYVVRNVCNLEEICFLDFPVYLEDDKGVLCSGPESPDKCSECYLINILKKDKKEITQNKIEKYSQKIERRFNAISSLYKENVDGVIFTEKSFETYFNRFIRTTYRYSKINPRGFKFDQPKTQRHKNKPKGIIHIGYIGSLSPEKGFDLVLKAFEKICNLKNFVLDIYTPGSIKKFLEMVRVYEEKYPGKIKFHGKYDNSYFPYIAESIDFALVPSRFDTFNRVVRELMYFGVPVIAADFFGASIIENNINGIKIPVGDHKALSDSIIYLLQNPSKIEELSKGVIETNIASMENEIDGIYDFYKQIINETGVKLLEEVNTLMGKNNINEAKEILLNHIIKRNLYNEELVIKLTEIYLTTGEINRGKIPDDNKPIIRPENIVFTKNVIRKEKEKYKDEKNSGEEKIVLDPDEIEKMFSKKEYLQAYLFLYELINTGTAKDAIDKYLLKLKKIFSGTSSNEKIAVGYLESPTVNSIFTDSFTAKGWVVSPVAENLELLVLINEHPFLPNRVYRNDVIDVYKQFAELNTKPGFILNVSKDFLKDGINTITCYAIDKGNVIKVLERNFTYKSEDNFGGQNQTVQKNITVNQRAENSEQTTQVFINRVNNLVNGFTIPKRSNTVNNIKSYDILIPIYNAYEHVKVCIESVVKYTNPRHSIYLLDDASPDERILPLLNSFAKDHSHVKVLTSEKNGGFIENMNRGFLISQNDAIILNSDTEVTENWIEKLDVCASSNLKIGIVSPLSNNATILSVPEFNSPNQLPEGMTVQKFANVVEKCSTRAYPEIPTAVGFCMLIKRKVLNEVGYFDKAFGLGYGEENDFCERSKLAGYKIVCCDDTYIHHYGKASFSFVEEIDERKKKNQQLLAQRWPQYTNEIFGFCRLNPLRFIQERIIAAINNSNSPDKKPHILQVMHNFNAPGGTELHTQDISKLISGSFRVSIIYPSVLEQSYTDAKYEFVSENIRIIQIARENNLANEHFNNSPGDISSELIEKNFANFIAGGGYDIVHFQHLLNWSTLLLPLIAKKLNKKVVISLHDYYLLCPEINMIFPWTFSSCNKIFSNPNDNECLYCISSKRKRRIPQNAQPINEYLIQRNEIIKKIFEIADVLIAPSEFVKQKFVKAFGESISEKINVIPHGIQQLEKSPRPVFDKVLKIGFLGNVTTVKGADILLDIAKKLANYKIKFEVFGNVVQEFGEELIKVGVQIHGGYKRSKLPQLLKNTHIVLIPSIWDETFCLTLSEAMALGIPVLASDSGAIGERIADMETGFLFKMGDVFDLAKKIIMLYDNPLLISKVQKNLELLKIKTIEENSKDYENLYHSILAQKDNSALDFPITTPGNSVESNPIVSVIALTYNAIDYTKMFFNSLENNCIQNTEIIIVDNASTDSTKDFLKEVSTGNPKVKVIFNESNVGFPNGINQALKEATGKYIVVANNDIVLTDGWLERMLELAKSNPVIGIVGPVSNIVSGVQLDKNAKYNSIEEMHIYASKIKKENAGGFFEFPRVAFLCTLIKREVIEKIGGLDERFSPGNFEDDDFCLRAQLAGYKTVIAQDVFIHHYGSKSFKANGTEEYAKRLEHNKQIFIDKWGADPEEIWLKGKTFQKRNPSIPIDANPFAESMKRAMVYLNDKDFEQALIYLNEAIENFDKYSRIGYEQLELTDILNLAGNTALMNQDFEQAQQYFEKELQQNPASSRACAGLAEVFLAVENYEAAKTMFEWSLKNDESNVNAKNGLKKVNGVLQLEEEHNSLED